MNKYENVVILNAELDEEATNKLVAKFSDLINKHGKLLDTNHMGKKTLAYEINKQKYGYYVVFTFESEPDFIEELQRNYRINEKVLKFLVIRLKDDFEIEKAKAKKAAKEEAKLKKSEVKTEEKAEDKKEEE